MGAKRFVKKTVTNPLLLMPKYKGSKPRLSTLFLSTGDTKRKQLKKESLSKTAVKNLKAAREKFEDDTRSSKRVIVDLAAGPKFA